MPRKAPTQSDPALTFIGHVSVDKIENINGTRTQPGGGALYAAIAAKTLNAQTALVSAIGKTFPFRKCFDRLNIRHVRTSHLPTTKFYIRCDKNWEANYIEANEGAGAKITASQIPSSLLEVQDAVHIAPMKPAKVARIVDSIRKRSPQVEISMSNWAGYINTSRQRKNLLKLASQVDFFMLNEFEAKALAQTSYLPIALERIRAKRLIITMGKLGAIISGTDLDTSMMPALSVPTEKIVDTTGAGDVWTGAFLATFKTTHDLMKSVNIASIISSIKCSGWGFESIKKLSFLSPSDVVEYIVALREGSLQKKISDF